MATAMSWTQLEELLAELATNDKLAEFNRQRILALVREIESAAYDRGHSHGYEWTYEH